MSAHAERGVTRRGGSLNASFEVRKSRGLSPEGMNGLGISLRCGRVGDKISEVRALGVLVLQCVRTQDSSNQCLMFCRDL